MGFSSIELLLQSPKTQIPNHLTFCKALKLLGFVVIQAIEALESFYLKEKLHEFDPHVGETACQIRAYKTLLLALAVESKKTTAAKKIAELRPINEKIKKDLAYYSKVENTSNARGLIPTTLEKFILENNYDYFLDDDDTYLLFSKILTIYKCPDDKKHSGVNIKKIMSDLDLSREGATRLSTFFQKKLSEMSCQFMVAIEKQLLSSTREKSIIENFIFRDDNAREVMPCFLSMKIILAHMYFSRISLIIAINRELKGKVIDKLCLPFYPDHSGKFRFSPNLKKPVYYIIEGTTEVDPNSPENKEEFINRFSKLDIEEIILLNEAVHPQFSGKILEPLRINPFGFLSKNASINPYQSLENELLSLQTEAVTRGCTHENNALFYIEHIFCGRMADTFSVTAEAQLKMDQQEDLLLTD
ncbi:MAG TPA: hypothetical protein VGV92_05555 [Gammaproteobacteria bacterium]|nr:hypothetical protein [Gammaproteobacteria bacterium]